jgi:hypothetical protein
MGSPDDGGEPLDLGELFTARTDNGDLEFGHGRERKAAVAAEDSMTRRDS